MEPVPPVDGEGREDGLPLSFAQLRLWFQDRLGAGQALHVPAALRLRGRLDADALETALGELARRHGTLRTSFHVVGGEPLQRVARSVAVPLARVDLSVSEPRAREAELRRLLLEGAERPFDLGVAPLMRATLFALGTDEHVLFLDLHHAVTDGWSMERVLLPELDLCYRAACAGGPPAEPAPALRYAELAAQERAREGRRRSGLGFWTERLRDLERLELSTDRPRPARRSFHSASWPFAVPAPLVLALEELGRPGGYTPAMLLLGAWLALLARLAGSEDVTVGTLDASRARPELEGVIGNFVRTLALRVDLSGDPRFAGELLPRVREAALAAHEHGDVPFERILEELGPRRERDRPPVFDVLFGMQYVPDGPRRLGDLEASVLRLPTARTALDLDLRMQLEGRRLGGQLAYATDLFDAATAQRTAGRLLRVLEDVAARPDARLSELRILSDEERGRLAAWGRSADGAGAGPRGASDGPGTLHAAFAARAASTPEAPALVEDGRRTSYAELAARAARVAAALRAHGVGPGSRVALCLERPDERIAAALGVLGAGAAFVPVDPEHPPARRAFVVEASRPAAVVTRSGEDVPAGDAPRVLLDALPPAAGADPSDLVPEGGLDGRAPAWVLFTSGSTGRPKGVVGSHAATLNRLRWQWSRAPWQPGEVACHRTAPSFVDSVAEVFSALCAGVPLVLVPPEARADPRILVDTLARHGVTRVVLVPSLLETLLDVVERPGKRLPRLARWTLSGEPLSARLAARLLAAVPHATLWNVYGTTEVTADATWFEVDPARLEPDADVPIGRPLDGVRCHLLDRWLCPVPPGNPGELYVGGAAVALGHLDDEDERGGGTFLPDPFTGDGSLMVRTGDVARLRPDGELELLGRRDRRANVRGVRVEPREVELALEAHPGVSRAAVVAREGRLVAYVVPAGAPPAAELAAHLRERLPGPLVPGAFVALDRLPTTAGGKPDLLALEEAPVPVDGGGAEHGGDGPRDTLELRLSQAWEEVLGVERVGPDDDFFALGGHSLSAIRLLERVALLTGARPGLADLFAEATVRRQAERIRSGGWSPRPGVLVPLQPRGERAPFFCVPPSVGVIELFELARVFPRERPLYGFEHVGLDGRSRPQRRVEEMAALYVAEMRRLRPAGPYHLGGHSFGGIVALEMAQQLRRAGAEVGALVVLDTLNAPRASRPRKTVGRAVRRSAYHLRRGGFGSFVAANSRKAARLVRMLSRLRAEPPVLRRVLAAHLLARWGYAEQRWPGTITLLQTEEGARRGTHEHWAEVGDALRRRVLPGGHLELLRRESAPAVAAELERCLDAFDGAEGDGSAA